MWTVKTTDEGWWDYIFNEDKTTFYPPVCKVSREVANLTWRKNTHRPVYGVIEFVCLSVTNFDLNYLRTGEMLHLYLINYLNEY